MSDRCELEEVECPRIICRYGIDCIQLETAHNEQYWHPPAENTEPECCVCYETIQKTNVSTTPCGHTFCFQCILKCMDVNNTCPYCRTVLREEKDVITPDYEDDEDEDATDHDELPYYRNLRERRERDDNLQLYYEREGFTEWSIKVDQLDRQREQYKYEQDVKTNYAEMIWDKTSNPVNGLIRVEETMTMLMELGISFKEYIALSYGRYDDSMDYVPLEKKRQKYNLEHDRRKDERKREYDERHSFMEEDSRRHNRAPIIDIVIDRIGNTCNNTGRPSILSRLGGPQV